MATDSTLITVNKTDFLKKPAVHLLIILVVGFFAYSNTFRGPIQWDGVPMITKNPVIKDIGNFISNAHGYEFNPRRFIGNLTFAVNYRFGGPSVAGYHVVNLVIHLITALLVYFLVTLTFKTPFMRLSAGFLSLSQLIALFSALLFVSHPLQTEAVTYVYQRFTSLATLFYLLSLVMYIKGRLAAEGPEETGQDAEGGGQPGEKKFNGSSIAFYLLSLVSAVLAMKTKEIAFTLPIIIILYEFTFFKLSFKKKLLFLVPIALTLIIIPVSLLQSNKSIGELLSDVSAKARLQTDIPRWDYLMTEMRVIVTYIRLLFAPINQNVDYDYPAYHSLLTPAVFFSFMFLLSIIGLGVWLLYSSQKGGLRTSPSAPYERLIGFGILWFFISLSVESSIIPIVDVIFEHRVYLPSVGFFVGISTGLMLVAQRFKVVNFVTAMLCLAIVALSGVTYARNSLWMNMINLWSDTVHKSPNKTRPHYNLGDAYSDAGRLAESVSEFEKAVAIKPVDPEAHYNLGNAYSKLHRNDEAIREYQIALTINPAYAYAHNNLGTTYEELGRKNDALREYKAAIDIMPDYADAHFNLGTVYSDEGQYDEAVSELQRAISIRSDYADAINSLGNVYLKLGRLNEAAEKFQSGLRLMPFAADIHYNLGITYFLQERTDDAIAEFQSAVYFKPDDADAHNNLGTAYFKQGHIEEAIREFQTAVDLRPNDADARRNLENASRAVKGSRKGK